MTPPAPGQTRRPRAAIVGAMNAASPLPAFETLMAIRGSKQALNDARDHRVADGLAQVASWNAAMRLSEDLMAALMRGKGSEPPRFRD